jgi:hypothetical protein
VTLDGGSARDRSADPIDHPIARHIEAGHALAGRMVGLFDRHKP